ncbi:MAG TPA: asparagine synthase (glutamine-hydrolyzing), partial [Vicinamibacterales bacterium]|nr:asparagine synthase (glutamine-hydrolyzing) [Vicinamibacterales bacterium]
RLALEAEGHRFATSSDTETIVHGYEQWGADVFSKLRGMFGIAIWDARERALLVARDRAGIKPLYYATAGGRLFFGSEAKCVLANPEVDRSLDPAALDHYLAYLYTPRDRSIFRGIGKLPPGHYLKVHAGRVEQIEYWSLPVDRRFEGSEGDALEALDATLAGAVASHMVSDVPLGAFLSGGIDSSVVVALMARASSRPVQTFSIGFDEAAFNELPHARRVAEHLGTEHHEFVVRPDALGILDRLIWHFDEPFGDASAIPTWYVSEIARRHVTVVLSGDGGDELFGGYDRYLPHPRVASFDRLAPGVGRAVAAAAWRAIPHGARGRNFLRHVARDPRGRYLDSVTFYHADERAALLSPDLRATLAGWDAEAHFAEPFARLDGLPFAAQMMAFDFDTYLPGDCLTKVDRMSMAHSIESRVPLLDHEVVEFAASLPVGMKIRGDRRKHLLKQLAFRLVPREILDRPKQGFGVPIGHWFRGSMREVFGDVLGSATARQRGYFDAAFVGRVLQEHLDGKRDHALRLWQLLVFELWHRQYVDAPAVAA